MPGRCRSRRARSSASAPMRGDPDHPRLAVRLSRSSLALALCFVIGWLLGYPALRVQHHYLAFVTLAFSTLVFLVFRNEEWLTGGIYGISGVPRPSHVRPRRRQAARVLLFLPVRARCSRSRPCGAGALALGPRLHGAARESAARRVARRRHAALYADGVRHRLGAGRPRRRALRAAGAVHRPDAVRARRCRSTC